MLQDPVGLIVLAVVFVAPIFYCQQVRAITGLTLYLLVPAVVALVPEVIQRL